MDEIIKTLEHTSVSDILTAFNTAFSNYIVPLQLTEQQLKEKILSDDIDLKLSAGVFEGDTLLAFVLHGHRIEGGIGIAYNAATGAIPSGRGKGLIHKIYDHLQPVLLDSGIAKVRLEVIKGNAPAIRTYENIGFEIVRTLNCYKGVVTRAFDNEVDSLIVEAKEYEWTLFQSFWDWQPSWQNAISTIEKTVGLKLLLSQDTSKNTNGYLIFNANNNRLMQLAVAKSKRGGYRATQLLHYVVENFSPMISVMNQDAGDPGTSGFLLGQGLDNFIDQFEMEMKLT